MSGFGRIVVIGTLLAGVAVAGVHAQAVLGDPKDAPRIFAANCSACHKSPRGLAKSGQIAGFLRQHYTTGPEMSAAMAAYLVAAGSAPPEKKGPTAADAAAAAAKTKSKRGEQLAAQPQAESAEAIQHRTLRGKQRQANEHEETAAPHATTAAPQHPAEETKQTAALSTPAAAPAPAPAPGAAEPPVVLNIPMPELPEGPPADLVQSLFSSSPLP